MEGKRKRAVYFLHEIAIVVIGVLIAVSINNYKERLDNKNYVEKILLSIESEIKLSQTEVNDVITRHRTILDFMRGEAEGTEQTLGEILNSLGGLQAASTKNISLRFFISNKAELVDFNLISQLSAIESNTNILKEKMNRLVDFTYEHINQTEDNTRVMFTYYLANVIDSEKTLLEQYTHFLETNKAYLKGGQ